jgi:tetratricopeptide (TPR) repeat protein
MSNIAYAEGEFYEAERLLRLALEQQPEFPEAHVALSNVLETLDRNIEAADEVSIAVQQRPDYPGALYNRALLSNKLRQYEDAEDSIRSFLVGEPEDLGAIQILANSLWGQGRCSESLQLFRSLSR